MLLLLFPHAAATIRSWLPGAPKSERFSRGYIRRWQIRLIKRRRQAKQVGSRCVDGACSPSRPVKCFACRAWPLGRTFSLLARSPKKKKTWIPTVGAANTHRTRGAHERAEPRGGQAVSPWCLSRPWVPVSVGGAFQSQRTVVQGVPLAPDAISRSSYEMESIVGSGGGLSRLRSARCARPEISPLPTRSCIPGLGQARGPWVGRARTGACALLQWANR